MHTDTAKPIREMTAQNFESPLFAYKRFSLTTFSRKYFLNYSKIILHGKYNETAPVPIPMYGKEAEDIRLLCEDLVVIRDLRLYLKEFLRGAARI